MLQQLVFNPLPPWHFVVHFMRALLQRQFGFVAQSFVRHVQGANSLPTERRMASSIDNRGVDGPSVVCMPTS
jgi:hypothetical protein